MLTTSLAISGLFLNLLIIARGHPITFLGILNITSTAVAALLSVPLWWLAARLGSQRALILSTLLQICATLLLALHPTAAILLLAYALIGIAAVLFHVSAAPLMMRHSDSQERDHLFSINAAIGVGAAGLGSLLAGRLPELFSHLLGLTPGHALIYQATLIVAAIGMTLALIPLLFIQHTTNAPIPSPVTPTHPHIAAPLHQPGRWGGIWARIPAPWRAIIQHPKPLLRLLLPPFLISWGAALLIPYLNLFFKARFAVADSLLGLIFAGLSLATGLAALLAPSISARIGKIRTIILVQTLSIPFLLLLGFSPLLGIAIGAAMMRAALFNMALPLYDAFVMEQTEDAARPTVIGLVGASYEISYLIAPAISTFTQAHYGFTPLFIATTLSYLLAIGTTYWCFIHHQHA